MTRQHNPSPLVGQAYSKRSHPVVRPLESSRRCQHPDRMLSNLPTKGVQSMLSLTSSSNRGISSLLSLLLPSNLNRSRQRLLRPKRPQSNLPNRRNNNNKRSHKNHLPLLNNSINSNSPPDKSTDPQAKKVSRRLPVILSSLKVNSSKRKLRCISGLKSVNSHGVRDTESLLILKLRRPTRVKLLLNTKLLNRSNRKLKLILRNSLKSMV